MTSRIYRSILIILLVAFGVGLVEPSARTRLMGLLAGNAAPPGFPTRQIRETKSIQMDIANVPDQLVIYEDERIKIVIPHNQFMAYRTSETPRFDPLMPYEAAKIETAFEQGFYPADLYSDLFFVSQMLELGQATIYDKGSLSVIRTVVMKYEDELWCPVCGGGSIAFYLPDGTLLYQGPTWKH